MDKSLKERLMSKSIWLRFLFMLGFAIVGYFAQFVIWIIAAIQLLLSIFMGKPNQNLLNFGKGLSAFVYQIMQYLVYSVDDKPYPFTPWPGSQTKSEE
jgi:hypothetical protein